MPNSLAQQVNLSCPSCGRPFAADIWLIVDTQERPDLLARLQSDTIHDLPCPHCQNVGAVDAPLLIYRPDGEPTLLFSPAQETSQTEDQEQARGLLLTLQRQLGPLWQAGWLADGLPPTPPRPLLAAALSANPEAALRQMAEQLQQAMAELAQNDPQAFRELQAVAEQSLRNQPLLQALQEFIAADSWNKSHDYLQTHPELLSDEADDALAVLAETAQERGDENSHRVFSEHLTLLRRCREIGSTAAFAEKLNIPPEALTARQQPDPPPPAGDGLDVPPQFQADLEQAQAGEQRYQQRGDRRGLDEAAAAWERIWQHPDFPAAPPRFQLAALNDGGSVFLRRYWAQGQLSDLDQALQAWQTAVQRTPPDSPDRAMYLNNLGIGLCARYARTGQLADLEEAIRVYREAVAGTPPDSPDLPARRNNLGNGLSARYDRSGQLADLEEAIRVYREAVAGTPPDSPALPGYRNNLGTGLRDRYARSGQLADLEEAIRVYREAVAGTPPDSPALPMYRNNLGNGLSARYDRSGQLADLEEAIRVYREAVAGTPPDSPALPMYRNNLGNGLSARYDRSGQLADLEEAIRVYREAVAGTQPDSPALPGLRNNLGTGLSARYDRSGQLADLEEAIRVYREAVAGTPPDSPALPGYRNNLGTGLRDRYARSGQLADLEEAIRVYREAVAGTPPDSPALPGYRNNLGTGLRDRYARSGQLADLEEAIRVYREAVAGTPPDSPALPMYRNNLGNGLRDRYARSGQLADLEEAIRLYREACQKGVVHHREVALTAARSWGNWALSRRGWLEAVEAYPYGLAALEQLYRIQTLRQSRQSWQKEAGNLVVSAAYAQARLGQLELAVVILEQGRTRQLNERLARDQAQLDALAGQQPHLADRYRDLAAQLRQLETAERQQTSASPQPPDWTQHRQQVQTATSQLDALIEQIRQVPGYETFQSAVSWATLLTTLQPDRPLLYLLTTAVGSLGLLLQAAPDNQGLLTPIWLDNFAAANLNAFLVKRANGDIVGGYLPGQLGQWHWLRAALREGLPELGKNVLAPLAAHLHRQAIQQLVIIPTGLLNLLPWHAAAYSLGEQTEIFGDAFCISYAPSAQSVGYSRQRVADHPAAPPTLLAVGDPQLVTAKPLVFSRHEASEIMQHFPQRGHLFLTTDATLTAVKPHLSRASYIHLSCHGLFEPENPLQSGLLFSHDERLTLADVLGETNLTAARLVVLSACQTAINDFSHLPDELIGLPAGFLQAGVPGVIGTLWPVNDHSTALLMVRFYRYHLAEGLPPAAALQKAQHWLRNATRQEIGDYYKSFIRLSAAEASDRHSEIRLEGSPDDHPYAHPFYWAAFAFYGV